MKTSELLCVAGCMAYTGNEVYHHKDCPFYPQSLSKMYDDLKELRAKCNIKRWCNTCACNTDILNYNCKVCLSFDAPKMYFKQNA
jgi:hypothetical protein